MSDNRLMVLVPTRGRPENVARLEEGRKNTGAEESDFLYAVDPDDPELEGYLALDCPSVYVLHARMRLGPTLNWLATVGPARGYPFIGFMGDDHLPRTARWDRRVIETLDVPVPRIAYGDDLLQGENLPTAVFLQSKIVRALGFMSPPEMVHLYLDNFWKTLGEQVHGLRYLPDVVIEHLHPAAGKAQMDAGYREANAVSQDSRDRQAWLNFEAHGMVGAVESVAQEFTL